MVDGQVGCAFWKSSFGCCVENRLLGLRPAKRPLHSVAQDQGGHSKVGVSVGGLNTWAGRGPSRRGPWKGLCGVSKAKWTGFIGYSQMSLQPSYSFTTIGESFLTCFFLICISLSSVWLSQRVGSLHLGVLICLPVPGAPHLRMGLALAPHGTCHGRLCLSYWLSDNLLSGCQCLYFSEKSLFRILYYNLIAYVSYFSCCL